LPKRNLKNIFLKLIEMDYQDALKNMKAVKECFVGIDSDGCVFDTMELKQKEFFIPLGIKFFKLFPVAGIARETWEFVNLYSVYRGLNRFPALLKVFELLEKREEVKEAGIKLPGMEALKEWISMETKLGNETLMDYCRSCTDESLRTILEWSEAVNADIGKWLEGASPFRNAVDSIMKISEHADCVVVSQTPLEALEREWKEHEIDSYVRAIAGQEHGTKSEHIALAAKGKYDDDSILVIGDAPGDMKAAVENNVLFYPVIPGREAESWLKLRKEAFERFLSGSYRGEYQAKLIENFEKALPAKAPWER
jgi:phosphoglycolate phosphatase-like HAD superfamily hydrolase